MVDVFAERPYTGNPLAVVLEADELPDATMQQVAAETNYSETTFVMTPAGPGGPFRVRIFTPAREIDFAGHPILGTAWVIRDQIARDAPGPLRLDIGAVRILVAFEPSDDAGEVTWFTAPPVSLGATLDRPLIARALGVAAEDLEATLPIQQATAGTSALLVPVRSLKALQQARLDLEAFAPLADRGLPPLVYLFCRETHDSRNQFCVRFFFEAHGVREDPATGNGAAFLGAYLLEHRVFPGDELSLRIEQGHQVRRPSLVLLRARDAGDSREIRVGGRVVPAIRGLLL